MVEHGTFSGTLESKRIKPSTGKRGDFWIISIDKTIFFMNKNTGDIPNLGESVSIEYDITGEDNDGKPYRWIKSIQKKGQSVIETAIEEPKEEAYMAKRKEELAQSYQMVLTQGLLNATGIVQKSLVMKKALDAATTTYEELTTEQQTSIELKDLFDAYLNSYMRLGISLAIQYERSN